jgi:drug/metabolite transporter (DMT)-like permease
MKILASLFNGADKKPSLRKILGTIMAIAGIVLLFTAEKPASDSWMQLAFSLRGAFAIAGSLFLFGIVTMQNIKAVVKKDV